MTNAEEDPDFNDCDTDLSTGEDDRLFDDNVTEGFEVSCDVGGTEREEDGVVVENEQEYVDDLECPSSEELLSDMSSDDEATYRFSEFMAETDMQDPQLHVG